MKRYIKMLPLVAAAFTLAVSCEKGLETQPEFSDVSWYFSNPSDLHVGVNDYLSFMDLSRNAVSHTWSIEYTGKYEAGVNDEGETGETYFLGGEVPRKPENIYDYVVPGIDYERSTDPTIHVLFAKAGHYNVRLYNVFNQPVTFYGDDTLESKFIDGQHVIDTAFAVHAYGDLNPSYAIYTDEECTDLLLEGDFIEADSLEDGTYEPIDTMEYDIMAGSKLYLVDRTTYDSPTGRTWSCSGAFPSSVTDSVATMAFNKLGEGTIRFAPTRTGNNIPGRTTSIILPLKLTVVQSSIPFELQATVTEMADERIQLNVNGEVDELSITDKVDNFKVHVVNADANCDRDIAVRSVSLDKDNKTIIYLTLAEPIYRPDVVTVSYTGGGEGDDILSADERVLGDATDLVAKMNVVELVDKSLSGFNNPVSYWAAMWDNAVPYSFEQNPTRDEVEEYKDPTLYVDMTNPTGDSGQFKFQSLDTYGMTLKPSTAYIYSYDIYVVPGATVKKFITCRLLNIPQWKEADGGWRSISAAAEGEWYHITATVNTAATVYNPYQFAFQIMPGGFMGQMHIDNFSLIEAELRPVEEAVVDPVE